MCDIEKVKITAETFFEVKDAEMFGGEGSVGYASTNLTGSINMIKIYEKYIQEQIKGFSRSFNVPESNIRVITEEEYKVNTEDDDGLQK